MPTTNPPVDPDAAPGPLTLFGTSCLVFAMFILLSAVTTENPLWPLPRSWYTHRMAWYLAGCIGFATGFRLLQQPSASHVLPGWCPSSQGQRFSTFRFYTRSGCHLCDEALDLISNYEAWLPDPEVIDIGTDPELEEKFDTCVPVIELDGKIRFRGRVNEPLLRRLIEGTSVNQS